MTRKHFEAIATIINKRRTYIEYDDGDAVCDIISEEMADYFATVNKNFDREKFLKACGVE